MCDAYKMHIVWIWIWFRIWIGLLRDTYRLNEQCVVTNASRKGNIVTRCKHSVCNLEYKLYDLPRLLNALLSLDLEKTTLGTLFDEIRRLRWDTFFVWI